MVCSRAQKNGNCSLSPKNLPPLILTCDFQGKYRRGPNEVMGLPRNVFFVRHGARIDQQDRSWIASSPTPYDPPLSIDGIRQAGECGHKISMLSSSSRTTIIHASPFLRCVQTALAIAEELSVKSVVRLDAWLGEWITPDYYVDIQSPPAMDVMVDQARNVLMRGQSSASVKGSIDWAWDASGIGYAGDYGEEWSAMHRRFRVGLDQLLRYYSEVTGEIDVILVTHGAGCNALIGAFTPEPVLVEVDIASMSQATLKTNPTQQDDEQEEDETVQIRTGRKSLNAYTSEDRNRSLTPSKSTLATNRYTLILSASTAHLTPVQRSRSSSYRRSENASSASLRSLLASSTSPPSPRQHTPSKITTRPGFRSTSDTSVAIDELSSPTRFWSRLNEDNSSSTNVADENSGLWRSAARSQI